MCLVTAQFRENIVNLETTPVHFIGDLPGLGNRGRRTRCPGSAWRLFASYLTGRFHVEQTLTVKVDLIQKAKEFLPGAECFDARS